MQRLKLSLLLVPALAGSLAACGDSPTSDEGDMKEVVSYDLYTAAGRRVPLAYGPYDPIGQTGTPTFTCIDSIFGQNLSLRESKRFLWVTDVSVSCTNGQSIRRTDQVTGTYVLRPDTSLTLTVSMLNGTQWTTTGLFNGTELTLTVDVAQGGGATEDWVYHRRD